MPTSPLDSVVNVYYKLTAQGAVSRGFNVGAIFGTSAVIPSNEVTRSYANATEMINDGFTTNDPEYKAAVKYFSATIRPSRLIVGRQFSGQTPIMAIEEARVANQEWYWCAFPEVTENSDILDIAEYIEAASPFTGYAFQSSDAAIANKTPGNLFETLRTNAYNRTFPLFSDSADAASGVLGMSMGRVTGLADSAFTFKFKVLPGITAMESLTSNQVQNIEDNNGNVYITRAGEPMLEQGTMASGIFADDIIYADKLANAIQIGIFNELYQSNKIPQTEAGVGLLRSAAAQACADAVIEGYLAPGKWTGDDILNLRRGDMLENGYVVMSQPILNQSQQDREDRKAPPIYTCVKTSGAIHSAVVEIDINR